jgi:HK97 family phage major capsid protein
MRLFEIKKQRQHALNKADSIMRAAEAANRKPTDAEQLELDTCMAAVDAYNPQIAKIERNNTIFQHMVDGKLIPAAGNLRQARTPNGPVVLSEDYYNDFHTWIGTRGQQIGAALYEGSGSAGGFAVPVIVDGQVVPLAPQEMGVRSIAQVVPTSSDIKIPRGTAFGTAAAKAESGASDNFFTESDPTLDQFTLSAFMAGITHTISWELAQDVPSFQQFALTDLVLALQMFEANLFVNGTGTGQAQGLIGNVGAGVTGM